MSIDGLDSFLDDIPLSGQSCNSFADFPTLVLDHSSEDVGKESLKRIRNNNEYLGESSSYSLGKRRPDLSGDSDDGKRLRQLEKNRETAKRCRRRKREKNESLLEEVVRLRETNKELEIQLKTAKSKLGETITGRGNRGAKEEQRRIDEMNRLSQMINQKSSEEEIAVRLKTHQEVYSDYGEERRKVLKAHVSQLENLLLPTKISKMLLWILEQDDEFFSSGNGSTIWNSLIDDLNISEEQKKELLAQRNQLGKQNDGIKGIIKKLKSLEKDILENMDHRRQQMGQITNFFTPSQQAKFLHWVEKNQACVHLLDTLWEQRTT